ncbi:TPA: hypothetical protein ACIPEX_004168, partial [Salmonella enterica subsp. enterica serovar Chester]
PIETKEIKRPPEEQHYPPMYISLISLVEVPFAYDKPLQLNMSDVSSGSNFFPIERNDPYRCA